uniref:Uncharacterized protein n=1 Tax=Romanomermis culicivorax TaxID=13658 RepID=A0A915L5J7_ROMCU
MLHIKEENSKIDLILASFYVLSVIIGWGPHECSPYNYDSFVIAARYFPHFATEEGQTFFIVSPNDTSQKYPSSDKEDQNSTQSFDNAEELAKKLPLSLGDNSKRDLAAFFAHAVQETGENDASLYDSEIRNKRKWSAGVTNEAVGYAGPILGPTSLVINNECGGEDDREPGGPGESRRIKAFKFFCKYFDVPPGPEMTLSCKKMPVSLQQIPHNVSWQPDWSTAWKSAPCRCAPATYGGLIPYYQKNFYPEKFIKSNYYNERLCLQMLYAQPDLYGLNRNTSDCLNYPLSFEHYDHDYEKIRRLDDALGN